MAISKEQIETALSDDNLGTLDPESERAIRAILQERLEFENRHNDVCKLVLPPQPSEALAALKIIQSRVAKASIHQSPLTLVAFKADEIEQIRAALQRNDVPQEMSQYDARKEFEKQYPNWEKYDCGRYKDRDIGLVWQGFQTACRVLKLAAPKPTGE